MSDANGRAKKSLGARRKTPSTLLEPKVQRRLLAVHGARSSDGFIEAAMKLLHAAVPCDVVFALVQYTVEGGRAMKVWGSDGSTFTSEYVRASFETNPTVPIIHGMPGCKAWPLSACFPSAVEMESNPWYQEFIVGLGMKHAMLLPFWDDALTTVEFALSPHRSACSADFSKSELATARLLHDHIDTAYRRVRATQSEDAVREGLERFLSKLPLPAVVVDWDERMHFRNVSARDALARWSNTSALKHPASETRLPEDLAAAVAEMKIGWLRGQREKGVDSRLERVLQHPTGLSARISTVSARTGPFGKPSFVIHIDSKCDTPPTGLSALMQLSPRQRQIASLVAAGLNNKEIAAQVGRSLNTIKSELYDIFAKFGIHSRTQLMLRLREVPADGEQG